MIASRNASIDLVIEEGLAILTFNRPEVLNALTRDIAKGARAFIEKHPPRFAPWTGK
jgi:enoyl-CoA hydratase/carnithine racemase